MILIPKLEVTGASVCRDLADIRLAALYNALFEIQTTERAREVGCGACVCAAHDAPVATAWAGEHAALGAWTFDMVALLDEGRWWLDTYGTSCCKGKQSEEYAEHGEKIRLPHDGVAVQ